MHLGRGPVEPVDQEIVDFYSNLLEQLRDPTVRDGDWQLISCNSAWDGNWTWESYIAFSWTDAQGERRLIAVNYSDHQSQCYAALPWPGLGDRIWRFQDQMGTAVYDRQGDEISDRGLYLDLPPWGYHFFKILAAGADQLLE